MQIRERRRSCANENMLLFNRPMTSLTYMALVVAVLGSHGQSPYQMLTKSGGSPSYTQGPQLDDSRVPAAGGSAEGFGRHGRRAALSDLRPPRPCHRLTT